MHYLRMYWWAEDPRPPSMWQRFSAKLPDWGEHLLLTLLAAAIVLLPNIWLTRSIEQALTPETCENPQGLQRMDTAQMLATASSVRVPEFVKVAGQPRLFMYPAGNAIDGDTGTAWSEGVEGLGHDEYLELAFREPTTPKMLCILNGFALSASLYERNGRARGLEVTADRGSQSVVLADIRPDSGAGFQTVNLQLGKTDSLRLTVTSTYAGQGQDRFPDTLISEIELWH